MKPRHFVCVISGSDARRSSKMVSSLTISRRTVNMRVLLLVTMQTACIIRVTTLWPTRNCMPRDCIDLKCFRVSVARDGPFTIYPKYKKQPIVLSCDQVSAAGGWAVFLRRVDGSLRFNRTWDEYRDGFGTAGGGNTNVWLGLERVRVLADGENLEIRIEGALENGSSCYINAKHFSLASEEDRYTMRFDTITSPSPAISDNWLKHNNTQFTTRDNPSSEICSEMFTGGWWYTKCHVVYLTGRYHGDFKKEKKENADSKQTFRGMYVYNFAKATNMKTAAMLLRSMDYDVRKCYNPCLNGGTCAYVAEKDTFRCLCPPTRCGFLCEVPSKCLNGGVCLFSNATQKNRCRCLKSFCGPVCQFRCENGGTCTYLARSKSYKCACPSSLCGSRCEALSPCKNDGVCSYMVNAKKNYCKCRKSTCGPRCELRCEHGGSCQGKGCNCPRTHCGERCEIENVCIHGGKCKHPPGPGGRVCSCPKTHCGARCQTPNPCKNAGTCKYDGDTGIYSCACAAGYAGTNCTSGIVEPSSFVSSYGLPITLFFLAAVVGASIFGYVQMQKKKEEEMQRVAEEEAAAEEEAERQRLLDSQEEADRKNTLTGILRM